MFRTNLGLNHSRYAGWLGTVAARYKEEDSIVSSDIPTINDSEKRLAVIAGTSTCHIVQSKEGHFVDGVWGPYKDPIIRGWWMNEGGQSSTGQVGHSGYPSSHEVIDYLSQLIDFIITSHPAHEALNAKSIAEGKTKFLGRLSLC
jgi:ribulose kinase